MQEASWTQKSLELEHIPTTGEKLKKFKTQWFTLQEEHDDDTRRKRSVAQRLS